MYTNLIKYYKKYIHRNKSTFSLTSAKTHFSVYCYIEIFDLKSRILLNLYWFRTCAGILVQKNVMYYKLRYVENWVKKRRIVNVFQPYLARKKSSVSIKLKYTSLFNKFGRLEKHAKHYMMLLLFYSSIYLLNSSTDWTILNLKKKT